MFGNVIGRTAHFCVEADTHYLALYVALVGKTSKGRKGVSAGQARRFFGPIDATWAEHYPARSPALSRRYGKRERFGNRFLWPCVQRSQYLPYGGAFVNVETLTARLRILLSVNSD
jgi:hypothetical protein